jgi:hypothetical protein
LRGLALRGLALGDRCRANAVWYAASGTAGSLTPLKQPCPR